MHTPHLIAGQPVVAAAEHGDVFNPSTGEVIARVPRGDVRRGIDVVEFSCGIAHLAKGESLPQVAEQIDAVTMREPIGVCAGITPFNFPALVPRPAPAGRQPEFFHSG